MANVKVRNIISNRNLSNEEKGNALDALITETIKAGIERFSDDEDLVNAAIDARDYVLGRIPRHRRV